MFHLIDCDPKDIWVHRLFLELLFIKRALGKELDLAKPPIAGQVRNGLLAQASRVGNAAQVAFLLHHLVRHLLPRRARHATYALKLTDPSSPSQRATHDRICSKEENSIHTKAAHTQLVNVHVWIERAHNIIVAKIDRKLKMLTKLGETENSVENKS